MHALKIYVPAIIAIITASASHAEADLIDYDLLNHQVFITSLRAGNHDAKGFNRYYFSVNLYALHNTSEERELPLEERRLKKAHLGDFGDFAVENLSFWRGDSASDEDLHLNIGGDALRELTWQAMRELEIKESEVSLRVQIEMFEREKRFFFFGKDRLIGEIHYYPLPPTSFDPPARTNRSLRITDELGADVEISVHFENSASS